jgi:hypothetical protein
VICHILYFIEENNHMTTKYTALWILFQQNLCHQKEHMVTWFEIALLKFTISILYFPMHKHHHSDYGVGEVQLGSICISGPGTSEHRVSKAITPYIGCPAKCLLVSLSSNEIDIVFPPLMSIVL